MKAALEMVFKIEYLHCMLAGCTEYMNWLQMYSLGTRSNDKLQQMEISRTKLPILSSWKAAGKCANLFKSTWSISTRDCSADFKSALHRCSIQLFISNNCPLIRRWEVPLTFDNCFIAPKTPSLSLAHVLLIKDAN